MLVISGHSTENAHNNQAERFCGGNNGCYIYTKKENKTFLKTEWRLVEVICTQEVKLLAVILRWGWNLSPSLLPSLPVAEPDNSYIGSQTETITLTGSTPKCSYFCSYLFFCVAKPSRPKCSGQSLLVFDLALWGHISNKLLKKNLELLSEPIHFLNRLFTSGSLWVHHRAI